MLLYPDSWWQAVNFYSQLFATTMSNLSDVGHSQWYQRGSHSYHAVDVEPLLEGHEMLDFDG